MRKIDRSAFLYMESQRRPDDTFAQCGSCAFWDRNEPICCIMDITAYGEDTCAAYIEGPQVMDEARILTYPEVVGFERRAVRCENCQYAMDGRCGLYVTLNQTLPDLFDLDTKISPYGCCNANTPKEGQ